VEATAPASHFSSFSAVGEMRNCASAASRRKALRVSALAEPCDTTYERCSPIAAVSRFCDNSRAYPIVGGSHAMQTVNLRVPVISHHHDPPVLGIMTPVEGAVFSGS